jgi:hypothetical protein
MSAYYSKFTLNTYPGTPYFEAHIPSGYPLQQVLAKRQAFRHLPPNLQELARLSKRWYLRNNPDRISDIVRWYDSDGNELDPDTGRRLTDAEISSQWQPNSDLDDFVVMDIPTPIGGFPDPDTWEPAEEATGSTSDEPTQEQLRKDLSSRGIEALADEYGPWAVRKLLEARTMEVGAAQAVEELGGEAAVKRILGS